MAKVINDEFSDTSVSFSLSRYFYEIKEMQLSLVTSLSMHI